MKTAFIFPGQGSQSLGMLRELYDNFDVVKKSFNQAADVLNYNLWDIIQNDNGKLSQTIYTQNAMLVAGFSCFQVLEQETNLQAEMMAGHSLGEVSALVASGCIKFEDGLKIVHQRATLMQEAVPQGAGSMAAILGLDDEIIIQVCNDYTGSGVVEAVNFNAVGQVVIAGNTDAVAKTCEVLKEKGAKRAVVLPVSVPSHSSLMTSAANEFLSFLNDFEFNTPSVAVLQNVDAKSHTDTQVIKQNLAKQLHNPVLWVKTINTMANAGITQTIEVGPGKVLSGLNRRINKNISSQMIFDMKTLNELQES